ncbi:unnamed protein product [Linum trigynum]|uniref:Cupin type-1 domain-containing protein n=1 Tax=Linum trigynum TaxID=586398 RepID=A0AAV2GA74_9ROSI
MAHQLAFLACLVALAACAGLTLAEEPANLQYFCVASPNANVRMNGLACKDTMTVRASDFVFNGLHIPGLNTLEISMVGLRVTPVSVTQILGLNTLGISMVRIDYPPWGINSLHTHPRGTEILTVIEGTLVVGFVTSNPEKPTHYQGA